MSSSCSAALRRLKLPNGHLHSKYQQESGERCGSLLCGLCNYKRSEWVTSKRRICAFKHRRENGMAVCLEKAAKAVDKSGEDKMRLLFSAYVS